MQTPEKQPGPYSDKTPKPKPKQDGYGQPVQKRVETVLEEPE